MTQHTFVGHLTADPELRFTQSGVPVASATIACNERKYNSQTNAWEDTPPVFWRFTVWRALAENFAETASKGDRVIVTGKITENEFTTRDGDQRRVKEVDADEVAMSLRYATGKMTRTSKSANNGDTTTAPHTATPIEEPPAGEPPF